MKRYFIALALPEAAREAISEAQTSLAETVAGAKWVDPAGAHLTLKFLGPVPEESAPDIIAVLEEAVRDIPVYTFAIRGIGGFPTPTRPRVIWAGIEDEGRTAELANPVERAMEWLGFKPEGRDFHPHITLARIKNPRRLESPRVLEETGKELNVENISADKVTLFESRLTPKGAIYTVVSQARLKDQCENS
jgi:RNA 2',3'-cyclic 3'-phosphodiesterase